MRAILPPHDESALKEAFFSHATRGFFVEVGANDPELWSETLHLERLGWDGVLIEPQPDLASKLRAQRRAQVFPVACSSRQNAGKPVVLHLAGIYSSLDPHLNISSVRPSGAIEVGARTLDEILTEAKAPQPFDFLSIDVEGHELDVLDGFDFARWQPRLLLIEDLAMNVRLHQYLQSRGYRWVRRTGLNNWYVPADNPMQVGLVGRLEFFRKYYLGKPFRHLREALRRVRRWLRERRQALSRSDEAKQDVLPGAR